MNISCENVRELLDRYYDRELYGSESEAVRLHLKNCANCSNELRKLERIGHMLRAHSEAVVETEDFSGVWDRVAPALGSPVDSERLSLWEKLKSIFATSPRPAWAALGAAALVILAVFAYLPFTGQQTFAANDCIIDSVESRDSSVMVYETSDTKMKIIWVMEQAGKETVERGVTS